jgi:hypothetical protein
VKFCKTIIARQNPRRRLHFSFCFIAQLKAFYFLEEMAWPYLHLDNLKEKLNDEAESEQRDSGDVAAGVIRYIERFGCR